jgi:bifunctional non-homologous end joining protein LigD
MTFVLDAYNCQVASIEEIEARQDEFVLEPKLDGFRLITVVKDDGVEMWTRSMKRQDGKLPHVDDELRATFPPGTVLDGEVVALTHMGDGTVENRFEDVQSVMLSGVDKAREKGKRLKLKYVLFDITYNGGDDVRHAPLNKRLALLEAYLENNLERKYVGLSIQFPATRENHEALVKIGFEGSVAKELSGPYRSGDRGKGWFKIKHQPEVDCVILGYQAGKGKFGGQVGAVIFGQPMGDRKAKAEEVAIFDGVYYVIRGQASGMDDKERQYMTDNSGDLIGTVIEVAHMGLMKDSPKFRHPQFKAFRPDKPASEVVWDDGEGGRR